MFVSLWLIETKAVGLLIGFLFTDVGSMQAIIFLGENLINFHLPGDTLTTKNKGNEKQGQK